jgi:hypothetical protein
LIAWLDSAPPEVRVAGRAPAQQTTALYVLPLEIGLPERGPVFVPSGFVEGRVVQMPEEGGMCGPSGQSAVYVGRGEAVFEFALGAMAQDVQIEALTLSLWSEGGTWRLAPEVALYDWSDESWAVLDEPSFGDNQVSEVEGLVSSAGMVRVRLGVETAGVGRCYVVGVGFEGGR